MLVGNMGFKSRMKYGIVGEHANIPMRLEDTAALVRGDFACLAFGS